MTRPSQKKYCSSACQIVAKQRAKTEAWLRTGVAAWVGGNRRHYIKLYLVEAQSGLCALCSRPPEWQGKPLAFVLDQVDGNADNNHRDNLRLVCPNCDSQLPTFKSRNRGNGRAWRRQRYADGKSY